MSCKVLSTWFIDDHCLRAKDLKGSIVLFHLDTCCGRLNNTLVILGKRGWDGMGRKWGGDGDWEGMGGDGERMGREQGGENYMYYICLKCNRKELSIV